MDQRRRSISIAFTAAGALFVGCAGQAGVTPTPAGTAAGTPATAGVHFEIKVPPKPKHRRRSRYVSPATASISIVISPAGGGPAVVTKHANITGSIGVVTVSLKPASYLATVTTYDAANEGGNVLSSGQSLPLTIAPGKVYDVTLVLGGVPRSFAIESEGIAAGTQSGGFVVYGTSAQAFAAIPEDADGYPIFGAGTPLLTGSVVSGSGWSITKQTSAANPYTFVVTPSGTPGTARMKISVGDPSTCALSGTACSTTFGITTDTQKLYVPLCETGCGVTGVPDEVAIFAAPYTGNPIATITSGVTAPNDVAVDKAGNVFVSNCPHCWGGTAADSITEYSPKNGYATPFTTITSGLNLPNRVVLDAADDVFVRNCNNCTSPLVNYVTIYTAGHYTATPVTITSGMWTIKDMLATPGGTLVADVCSGSCGGNGGDWLAQYLPPYSAAPATITQNGPLSIAFDPSGNLWAGDCNPCSLYSTVAEYAPEPGEAALFGSTETNAATQADGVYAPIAIAVDSAKNLFVTNGAAGGTKTEGIREFAPVTYTVGTALFAQQLVPNELQVDSQGTLVMDEGGGEIVISNPPYTSSTGIAGDGLYGGNGSPLRFTLAP